MDDKLTCPYCGYEDVDGNDYDPNHPVKCEKCGKKFWFEREETVAFESRTMEDEYEHQLYWVRAYYTAAEWYTPQGLAERLLALELVEDAGFGDLCRQVMEDKDAVLADLAPVFAGVNRWMMESGGK